MPDSARQVVDRLLELFVANKLDEHLDLYADDAVLESMFTGGNGLPSRIEGLPAIKERITAASARATVRRNAIRNLVVHETADPEVIVAEYDLDVTVQRTGKSAVLNDVLVIRVHNGRITQIRAYANQARTAAVLAEATEPAN